MFTVSYFVIASIHTEKIFKCGDKPKRFLKRSSTIYYIISVEGVDVRGRG